MTYTVYEAMPLSQMLARVQKYYPGDGYKLVEKAYLFAQEAHKNQYRKSGEPYFTHPCFVASILVELSLDPPTIAAGLLHDTVEDCEGITLDTIRQEFGEEVAMLVDGVTKLNKLDFADKEEAQAESLRKMILAMGKDIRVVLIKLADRLHNMRTLKFQKEERRVAIARETLDIYAPIAHRLGVYAIKQELEDLSLRYIDPVGYENLVQKVGQKRSEREENIRMVIDELSAKLDEQHIHHTIDGRPKHFYSIYRKMVLQNKPFDQIYDLIAIRVLVDSVPDCYAVLGIVHTLWNQMPGRFKDYISVPKANMYQSLHTTVVGGRKMPFPFEVQIRTWEMHRIAEYGIAAHWRYKEGGGAANDLDSKLYWVRQILDWQSDTRDSREFLDTLKTDLFSEEVFLFTPKGDVINLPTGATCIDFAYAIHSAVGNHMVGAKVNGRIVQFDYHLRNGDVVEVMTSKSAHGPSRDWVKIARSSNARSKIRQWFKKEKRDENIVNGRQSFESELKRTGVTLKELTNEENLPGVLKKLCFTSLDDMYAAIGYGGISALKVVGRLREDIQRIIHQHQTERQAEVPVADQAQLMRPAVPQRAKGEQGIVVEGLTNCLVKFSKCCTPVPGDDIVGFITRGYGISVHRADCPNADPARRKPSEAGRWIKVSWGSDTRESYRTTLEITAKDRINIIMDVSTVLSSTKTHVSSLNARSTPDGFALLSLDIDVPDSEQLRTVMRRLEQISGVMRVTRPAG